jgi:hypothetical protein
MCGRVRFYEGWPRVLCCLYVGDNGPSVLGLFINFVSSFLCFTSSTMVLLKFADPVSNGTFAIDEASNRWPIMVFLVPANQVIRHEIVRRPFLLPPRLLTSSVKSADR